MLFRLIKITATALFLIALAGASTYLTLMLLIGKEQRVVVPDLAGQEVLAVLARLSDLDLDTRVVGSEFSDHFLPHQVIHQMPPAGTEIKQGRSVRLIISKGPEKVPAPSLTGLSVEAARTTVRQKALCPGRTVEVYDDSLPAGRVKAQNPVSGSLVSRTQCVDMLVSRGPRPGYRSMPALVGRPIGDVARLIELSNLRVGAITHRKDPSRAPDTVMVQHPPAGMRVTDHTPVDLMLNRPDAAPKTELAITDGPPVRLLRHRTAAGFRPRHLRVTITQGDIEQDLFDETVAPGHEVWLLVPDWRGAVVVVYEDGELKSEHRMKNG